MIVKDFFYFKKKTNITDKCKNYEASGKKKLFEEWKRKENSVKVSSANPEKDANEPIYKKNKI